MTSLLWLLASLCTGLAVFTIFYGMYDTVVEQVRIKLDIYSDYIREQLDSMFIDVSKKRCLAIVVVSTVAIGMIPLLLLAGKEYTWAWNLVRFLFVLAFGYLGWRMPRTVLRFMWNRRVAKFDEQMLDALTLMSNALKAGLSFIQSMDTVVRELPNPISQEFGLVLRHQQLGGGVNESLEALEKRMRSEDVRIVVTAIMILRDTGGNLSETFDTIAYTIRERKKVKGKIAALTAQGVMQGIIIFCMPFILGTILYIMDPVLIARMWQTVLGVILLGVMLLLQGIGGLIMKKVVTIEV